MSIKTRVLSDPSAVPPPDIVWDGVRGDFAVVSAPGEGPPGGLRGGESFATAVAMLLFGDAQCAPDELTLFDAGDRRGWVGDGFDIDATAGEGAAGSKLWRYRRAPLIDDTARSVEDECRRVLQTLIDQQACASFDVAATPDQAAGRLELALNFYGRNGASIYATKFDDLWQAMSVPGRLLRPAGAPANPFSILG